MSTFYEIDSTHISLKEFWWWHKSPLVLISLLNKLFRVRTPCSSDDPNIDSTLPCVVEQLPPDVTVSFAAIAAEFTALGFLDPVYHIIHDPGTRATIYWATYRHESGKYLARIHQRVWQQAQKPNRGTFPIFLTQFSDGTFAISSAGKPDMDAPATVTMNRLPGTKCNVLWQKHLALTEKQGQRKLITPAKSQDDLITATERLQILLRDFHLARGVFRVRNAEEQATADSFTATVEQGRASGLQYPEIIAELDKLQQVKPAWRGTLWVLVGSVILFFLIGAANWDWKFALWLIPVLFLHESGHWIAMRIFKYRNLRMFFIPLFGAAVTGRHWNVAGWKKALVSLAGPLPGIFLGCIVGIVGMITHKRSFIEVALILISINGFNLLPILPLDGGQFMQAILFCRNRWLDVSFRVLAIIGIVGLGFFGFGRALIYVGIAMAIALPITFKLAKVADALRRANLPPANPADDRISVDIAQTIISEVKSALPTKLSDKAVAEHSLNVFENLNARPPGVIGTISLLVLYGGGVLMAVLCGILFLVAKETRLRDFVSAAARQPRYTFACGSIQTWQGSEIDTNPSLPRIVLVTTLDKVATAKSTFDSMTTRLPRTGQLMLFGQTLLVTLPGNDDRAREQWFDRLQILSTNTFVAVSNQPVTFSLTFIAPTSADATNLENTLSTYFEAPGTHLIPPWSPEAKNSSYQAYEHARQSWREMDKRVNSIWTNAELQSFDNKIFAAMKRGSLAEANQLTVAKQKLGKTLQAAANDSLQANPDFDPQLVALHAKFMALSYTNRTEREALMSEVEIKLGKSAAGTNSPAPDYSSGSGYVVRHGLLFEMPWISMSDPVKGLPALAGWLCNNQCIGIRYEFDSSLPLDIDGGSDDAQ